MATMKTVDEEIARRAEANLNLKLTRFREQVNNAIWKLDPSLIGLDSSSRDSGQQLLNALASGSWPTYLLEKEHSAELSKLFAAIDRSTKEVA